LSDESFLRLFATLRSFYADLLMNACFKRLSGLSEPNRNTFPDIRFIDEEPELSFRDKITIWERSFIPRESSWEIISDKSSANFNEAQLKQYAILMIMSIKAVTTGPLTLVIWFPSPKVLEFRHVDSVQLPTFVVEDENTGHIGMLIFCICNTKINKP
jgi:hypothetical protein